MYNTTHILTHFWRVNKHNARNTITRVWWPIHENFYFTRETAKIISDYCDFADKFSYLINMRALYI